MMLQRVGFTVMMATLPVFAQVPDDKGFICDWLLAGPYPSYQVDGRGLGLDTDFLAGEAECRPYPGMSDEAEFVADKGKLIAGIGSTNEWGFTETKRFPVVWSARHFDRGIISLDKMFLPIDDYFVTYAACYVESPRDQDIKVRMGSDDDHKAWLNGRLLGRANSSQAVVPDNFIYSARLRRGINRLLLKIVDRTHGCGFCCALSDMNDQPLRELRVFTDHPGREREAEAYNAGYMARFSFGDGPLFAGQRDLSVQFWAPEQAVDGEAGVAAAAPPRYRLELQGRQRELASGEQWDLTVDVAVGEQLLAMAVYDGDKQCALLQQPFVAYSREDILRENAELPQRIRELRAANERLRRQQDELATAITQAQERLAAEYARREEAYAAQRRQAVAQAPRSIDEPLPPLTRRSRLCLNGEWEISADRQAWSSFLLPQAMCELYFRIGRYPVRLLDPKNRYGKVEPLPGWDDLEINMLRFQRKVWYRRHFVADGVSQASFVCENIAGHVKVYVNGEYCGEYLGSIGIVEIPLKNVQAGENLIELDFDSYFVTRFYGLRGDIFIDFTPSARVQDSWIKTSWRNAELSVQTELVNSGSEAVAGTLRQAVVDGQRLRLRLPEQAVQLPADGTTTVSNASRWADPVCWGIGGDYGTPQLYELVSELVVDGEVIDRHCQSFGFREFWIHATDFYLNGRRIILQGDVGHAPWGISKIGDVFWPLYRQDGINILRVHDSDYWAPEVARQADRYGMLIYAQSYPRLHDDRSKRNNDPNNYVPLADWPATATHQYNLDNYRRWHRMLRNNPSVVIWSTDNEILTQAWDTAEKADFNVRNDKIGAMYGQFVKSLDPTLVMTRNGDIGTQTRRGRWFEDPPCDTANYHYADFNVRDWVINWQKVYEYRPVIFGETLYCSYGAWDNWIGPIPSQVAKKAARVREIAGLYRELGIPAQIYMGLGLDGFVGLDDSGQGNPWGVTAGMIEAHKATGTLPPGLAADQFPYYRLPWPALSGKGYKPLCVSIVATSYGSTAFNWFDASRPSHVRNAVNDAYRDSLLPQPPLAPARDAECIVHAAPGALVWSSSERGERYGMYADAQGRAWFQFPQAGRYEFNVAGGLTRALALPERGADAAEPGFEHLIHLQMGSAD